MAQRKKSASAKTTHKNEASVTPIASVGEFDRAERVIWVCLHLLLFLVPIAMSNLTFLGIGGGLPLTFDQFDIPKLFLMRAFALIGLGAWGVKVAWGGGRLRRTKLDWWILAFLAWVALSTVTSIHWPTALFGKYRRYEGLLSFLTYASVFFLIVQVVDRPARIRSLVRTLFFSSAIVAGYGVLQYLGADPVEWGTLPFEANRSFSTYGNPDLLGGFIVIALPLAFALALSERVAWMRTVYWTGALLIVSCWITAFTRGAWIGGGAALIVLAVATVRKQTKPHGVDLGFIAAAVAGVSAIVIRSLGSTTAVMNVWARIQSIFEFGSGSALTRFQIWDAAWRATMDRPMTGFGPDTFRLVFPGYKPAEYVGVAGYLSVADNVHNYVLQLAAALGIPGVILFYALFGRLIWLAAGPVLSREDRGDRLLYAGVWAAVVGYLVHLFFGLSVTGSTVFLWVCAGLLLAATAREVKIGPIRSEAAQPLVAVAVVLVVGVLSVGNFMNISADNAYLHARIGIDGPDASLDAALTAVERNPFNDMYRTEIGMVYTDAMSSTLAQARSLANAGQDSSEARQRAYTLFRLAEAEFLEMIEWIPPEYDNYVFLSNLYNNAGVNFDEAHFEDAARVAEQGIEVEPFGPAIRVQAATAYASMGDRKKAIEHLEMAVDLDPNYLEAHIFLADLYSRNGSNDEARSLLEHVLRRDAGNSQALSMLEALEATAATETGTVGE